MRMPFYTYLMRFRSNHVDDWKTELANLAFADSTFPKQSTNFQEISDYLETHANFSFPLNKFDEIWEDYVDF